MLNKVIAVSYIKQRKTFSFFAFSLTLFITGPQVSAAIISNGVSLGGNVSRQVWINAWRQNYGGSLMATFSAATPSLSASLVPISGSCGISHEWVILNPGDVVGASAFTNVIWSYDQCGRANFASASVPKVFPTGSSSNPLTLGFRLGGGTDWNYGWAQFVSRVGSLEIVGSSQEDSGLGIIAGSPTAVPEPASLSTRKYHPVRPVG